jgi:hypothetical protein
MCEEAHRYMPADHRLGFAPTRHALSRIAKEGRKYGCFLGVGHPAPGRTRSDDPVAMLDRLRHAARQRAGPGDHPLGDRRFLRLVTLSFLSSMGQREAIAFGEGVATTMRMKFETLPKQLIPGLRPVDLGHADEASGAPLDLNTIIMRMRNVAASDELETSLLEAQVQQRVQPEPTLRRTAKLGLSDDDPNFGYGLKSSTFGSRF